MFTSMGSNLQVRLANMLTWMKAQSSDKWSQPVIEQASTAKYIVQQYTAATGGQQALNAVHSMCVTGQVKITASEFHQGDVRIDVKSSVEMGGFVLWQKDPDFWCLELIVSGSKVVCGSNGKLSWRHSSTQQTPISKGPPRPLHRFLQGLDPRSTANLFIDATCIGEKIISNEDCFILKIETSQAIREAQSGPNYEIIHHTIWGYFSQRSGLLIQFERPGQTSLGAGTLSDLIGRKYSLILSPVFFFFDSLVTGSLAVNYVVLVMGSLLVGIGKSYGVAETPVYITELSSDSTRGFLTTFPKSFGVSDIYLAISLLVSFQRSLSLGDSI
ncbi:hypothetical protein CRYUN_Cryun17cG0134300 [Craigia yunnanensis]